MLRSNVIAGEVICKSASIVARSIILIPIGNKSLCIDTKCFNGSNNEFLVLKPGKHGSMKIKAVNVSISKGNGFYASIRADKVIVPANLTIQFYLANSSSTTFTSEQSLSINDVVIVTKTPIITTNEAIIREVLFQGIKYPYLAKDLIVRGTTSIEYVVGDDLLVLLVNASNVDFVKGLNIYDEFVSLPLLLKYGVVYVIMLILTYILRLSKKKT